MSTLSKAEIADALCHEIGLTKNDAKLMVEYFFEEIRTTLESGQHIKFSKFGNFILKDKTQRPARNPRTGEVVPVEARRVVTFKAGSRLKQLIEQHQPH